MMKQIFTLIILVFSLNMMKAQTGIPISQMTGCDNLVSQFMTTHNIPGASFTIAKNGKVVYSRAFGKSNVAGTENTLPSHLFRIASLSKPITGIAIMKMIENGVIALTDTVFGTNGILKNHTVLSGATITDNRIYDITVQNLLEHTAGWDRNVNCFPNPASPYPWNFSGCDPIAVPLHVTQTNGTTNPSTEEDMIIYVLEKGLNFTPGTNYVYSNMGYLILGEIIEEKSGMSYEDYVKTNILAPLGIYDMHMGRNLLADKQEREVEYVGNGGGTYSCYGGSTNIVPWEYGGFNLEAMDAHGGWIATSRDLVKLVLAVDGFSTQPDILNSASITAMTTPSIHANYAKGWSVNGANNWWHTGALDGTATMLVRTSGQYVWSVLLNKRVIGVTSGQFWSDFDALPWNCVSNTTTFPTHDLGDYPTANSTNINTNNVSGGAVNLSWTNGNGTKRLVVATTGSGISNFPMDGTGYTANAAYGSGTDLGDSTFVVYDGTGNSVNITNLQPNIQYHFRVFEYNQSANTGNYQLYKLSGNTGHSVTTSLAPVVTIGTASGCDGGNFNVPVDIINGDSIGAFSFKIAFDTARLDFSQLVNPHPNLGATLTNTNASNANSTGEIIIAWFDLSTGKNFGASKLFDIEFIAKDTGTTAIDWISAAPYGEISDGAGNVKTGSVFNNGTATVNPGIIGSLAGDTTICQGEPTLIDVVLPNSGTYDVVLEANNNAITLSNQSAGAQLQVTPQHTINYILKSITNTGTGCSLVSIDDTITINVNPTPVVNLGNDTTFCAPDSLILDAGVDGTDYLWSTAAVSQTIHVLTTDVYSVIVSNSFNCFGYDTISVTVHQKPTGVISGDTTICAGNPVSVNIDIPPSGSFDVVYSIDGNTQTLSGQNGTIPFNITPTDSSLYVLQSVTDAVTGCSLTNINDSAAVYVNPVPSVDLGNDTTMCSDETITLDAGTDGTSYLWSDASTNQTFVADTTGIFSVAVTNSFNCTNTDSVSVEVTCFTVTGRVYYPNNQNSSLKNTEIELRDFKGFLVTLPANSTGNKVFTDTSGNYTFTKVPLGSYVITPKIDIPAGGWTIDDAFITIQIFAQIIPFDALDLRIGDVNADGIVNAVDGMLINKRANSIFPFPAGSWVYDNESIILDRDLFRLIRAVCIGDLNKSYVPPQ